ncbi:hypothetical protein Hanom_Chr00s001025g01672241 [Helianthus anomalus]
MWMIHHQLMNSGYSKVPWVIGMGTYAVLAVLLKMSPTKYQAHTPATTTTTIGRNPRRNATNATRNTRNATTTLTTTTSASATILKPNNNGTTTTTTTCVSNATNGNTISVPI